MGKGEEGERGEPFDEAELPRRDRVPAAGFSRPSDVNASPESTALIPPFRAHRRRIARRLTFAVVAGVGLMAIRLVTWTARVGATDERALGISAYFFLVACTVAGFFGIRTLWRWANAPDPADVRNPIMRGLPPMV